MFGNPDTHHHLIIEQANGATPAKAKANSHVYALHVENSKQATATLNVRIVDEVKTIATSGVANNVVGGLWNTDGDGMPTCSAFIGASSRILLSIEDAPGSSLRVDCPGSPRLTLQNKGGACLLAVWASASYVMVNGNGPMAILLNPRQKYTTIDVRGMDGAAASLAVYLSPWKQNSGIRLIVRGGWPSQLTAKSITVHACQGQSVRCLVNTIAGRSACRILYNCIAQEAAARAAVLSAVNNHNPCVALSS